jgi:hypothetical protein
MRAVESLKDGVAVRRLAEARTEKLKRVDDEKAAAQREATLQRQQQEEEEEAKRKQVEAEARAKEELEGYWLSLISTAGRQKTSRAAKEASRSRSSSHI